MCKTKWMWVICTIAIIVGLSRLYYHLTDDFHLGNISHPSLTTYPGSHFEPLDVDRDQIDQILHQRFDYLGKGAQSYAFVSQDGLFVLKFFKFKHLKPHWIVDFVPSISPFNHIKYHYKKKKEQKLQGLFKGYQVAYLYNRDLTGLLFLHLTPTNFFHQKLNVFDKMGGKHEIDLDQTIFLLQKKGEPLGDRLTTMLDLGHLEEAKHSISVILGMFVQEYQKGIYDRDHEVMQNTGFIGDQPFHLDAGKMTKDDTIKDVKEYKKDLELVFWKMNQWIKTRYPQYQSDFSPFFFTQYHQLTGEKLESMQMSWTEYKAKRRYTSI